MQPNVIFLVRHAEREGGSTFGDDPPLSAAGAARATLLKTMLRPCRITTVLTSTYRRTIQTGAPTAAHFGVMAEALPSDALAATCALKSTGDVLIVGHSNTVVPIISKLGGPPIAVIGHEEFDNLFVLTLGGGSPPRLVHLKYPSAGS
jgi:broad specificity phosphatase PhoE